MRRNGWAWSWLLAAMVLGALACSAGVIPADGGDPIADATPALRALSVVPATTTMLCGGTLQLSALARYADGTSDVVATGLSWTSSAPAVASVDSNGLAQALGAGTATVTAGTLGALTSDAAVVNVRCTPVAIEVAPASTLLMAGTPDATPLHAEATFPTGVRADVTEFAAWTSSDPALVRVSNAPGTRGYVSASGAGPGTAYIRASLKGVDSATALVGVVPAVRLSTITVTPGTATLCPGATQRFTATGIYSDGRSVDVSSIAVWTSSAPGIATIDDRTGIATGVSNGTTTVRATIGAVSGEATVTAGDPLIGIQVSPPATSIAIGNTTTFTATGNHACGMSRLLTTGVSWSTTMPGIATITASGVATGITTGTVTIRATVGTITGTASLVVNGTPIRSIVVTPSNPTLGTADTLQLTATGTFSDGSTQRITSSSLWSSAMPSVAAVSSTGLVTGTCAGGPVTITASFGGMTSSTNVTVSGEYLIRIDLTPSTGALTTRGSVNLSATGVYSVGGPRDLTADPLLVWTSSNLGVAVVSNSAGTRGLVTAVGPGTADIHADWTVASCIPIPRGAATINVSAP